MVYKAGVAIRRSIIGRDMEYEAQELGEERQSPRDLTKDAR